MSQVSITDIGAAAFTLHREQERWAYEEDEARRAAAQANLRQQFCRQMREEVSHALDKITAHGIYEIRRYNWRGDDDLR